MGREELTQQQLELLALIVVGHSNQKVADKLGISPHQVEREIQDIFVRIKVQNRIEATLWTLKNL